MEQEHQQEQHKRDRCAVPDLVVGDGNQIIIEI